VLQRNTLRDAGASSALACYVADSIKWPDQEPKVLAPVAEDSEKVATGTYMRMEIGPSMLTAPDRTLTRSSCPFPGPTKGSRKRSGARRGGCAIPTCPCGLRT
jgi:hypothetical protein